MKVATNRFPRARVPRFSVRRRPRLLCVGIVAALLTRSLPLPVLTAACGVHPAATNRAFVNSNGAATNKSTLGKSERRQSSWPQQQCHLSSTPSFGRFLVGWGTDRHGASQTCEVAFTLDYRRRQRTSISAAFALQLPRTLARRVLSALMPRHRLKLARRCHAARAVSGLDTYRSI